MSDLFDPRAALSLMPSGKMAQRTSNWQSCDKVLGNSEVGVSRRRRNMDRVANKASGASEVPLRAFWCKVRIPLRVNPA